MPPKPGAPPKHVAQLPSMHTPYPPGPPPLGHMYSPAGHRPLSSQVPLHPESIAFPSGHAPTYIHQSPPLPLQHSQQYPHIRLNRPPSECSDDDDGELSDSSADSYVELKRKTKNKEVASLTEEQLLICQAFVLGYSLVLREWGKS